MRLLMGGPNVLLLDEPTNDLDIDTLTALEDLLDGWAGTLVVISHDRYFVERVCDDVYAITPSGGLRHVPGGIDQYLQERHGTEVRQGSIEKLAEHENRLTEDMQASATNHAQLAELQVELERIAAERGQLETAWFELSESLEAR